MRQSQPLAYETADRDPTLDALLRRLARQLTGENP